MRHLPLVEQVNKEAVDNQEALRQAMLKVGFVLVTGEKKGNACVVYVEDELDQPLFVIEVYGEEAGCAEFLVCKRLEEMGVKTTRDVNAFERRFEEIEEELNKTA